MRLAIIAALALAPGALGAQEAAGTAGPPAIRGPQAAAAPEALAVEETQEAAEPEMRIGGLGLLGCEGVVGVENLPTLAAATDWSLGYLAGRQDAGHMPTDTTVLSVADPADVAVAIRLYCNEYPYALVIDALRDYGTRAFAAGPMAEPSLQPRLPRIRPRERPADWPPAEQTDRPELVLAATDAWLPARRPAPRPVPVDAVMSTRSGPEGATPPPGTDG